MRLLTLISVGAVVLTVGSALCATDRMQSGVPVSEPPEQADLTGVVDEPLAAGQVVAVDHDGARLTVAHRGVGRLYLEPGTRIFRVEDPILLTGLTPGDKIRFDVERDGKSLVITRLQNSN